MSKGQPLGNLGIEVHIDDTKLRQTTTNMKSLLKSVNSEFQANMSAVKRTGSEMDILSTRVSGLNKKYETQKKVVEQAKKAYEEAEKVANDPKATQNQIRAMESKRQAYNKEIASLNDVKGALNKAQKEQQELIAYNKKMESSLGKLDAKLKATGDKFKEFGSKMSGIGKAGMMSVTAPITGLGVLAVKTAGEYDASASQFKQVFGDLEGQATKSLDKISKETGLLPNSLRDSFTKISAFAKTTGMDTKEALDLTSRATLAAADSSAFYDKSLEEVTESLQSYLKGNFENDAALGISSTETTRNAKANELYGKSFKDLAEDQKQLTLLAMVEEGNKLSGALGQASRESDQLGTQLGNVKTASKDFLAEIGKPILPLAVQGLKGLTKVSKEAMETFKGMSKFGKGLTLGLAGLVAITPPILIGVGMLATGLGAIASLGAPLVLTIGGIVAGLAILGTGFTLAYKNSEKFRDVVNGGFKIIKKGATSTIGAVKGIFQLFKGDGTQGVITLSKILPPDLVVNITKTVDTIKKLFSDMSKGIVNAFKQIGGMLSSFWKQNGDMIIQAMQNFMVVITPILNVLKTLFSTVFKVTFAIVKTIVVGTFKAVVGVIKGAINVITGIIQVFSALFTGNWKKLFSGLWKICKGAIQIIWNGINLLFFGRIIKGGLAFAKGFTKIFPSLWNGIKNIFVNSVKYIYKFVTNIWSSLSKTSSKTLTNMYKGIWNILTNLRKAFTNIFSAIWNKTKDIFNSILKFAPNAISKTKDGVMNGLHKMKSGLDSLMDRMKKKVSDSFTNMIEGAKELPSKIGNGIKNGAGKAVDGVKSLGNKMIDKLGGVVNGTIGGINTVTDKLGIGKKVKEWKVPKFSTGTKNGALANNSLITVGDKGKGNWKGTRELVQFPNGQTHLFNDETTFHAPAGTKVFSNYETEHILGNAPLKFSEGTGVGGFFSNIGKGIVDGFGDIMDFIKNPSILAKKLIEGVLKKTGFGGLKGFSLDLAKGGFNKVKDGVVSFITKAFEDSGAGDGGVLDISKLAYHYGKDPAYISETGRPFHEGVDFSYVYDKVRSTHSGIAHVPPFMAGGYGKWIKIVQGALEIIYGHMSKIFVKNGQHVEVGDTLGITGNTGFSTGPHLHYEMRKNGRHFDPEPFLRKQATVSGAGGNWTGTVMKALALSGLPTTTAYKNAWLRQIQSESGGNPRAVQHGYVDVNTGGNEARGLVQVIPPTFRAYKLNGMDDIYNPLHNLVAGMRYSKARYGKDLLSVIGHGHGYKTGGIVNGKQLAWLDEENKGEVVIPLNPSRRSDAMKLMAYTAMKILPKERGGQGYRPNIPNVNVGSNSDTDMMKVLASMVKSQQKQIEILTEIAQSNQDIADKDYTIDKYEHKKQVFEGIEDYNRKKSRKSQFKPSFA